MKKLGFSLKRESSQEKNDWDRGGLLGKKVNTSYQNTGRKLGCWVSLKFEGSSQLSSGLSRVIILASRKWRWTKPEKRSAQRKDTVRGSDSGGVPYGTLPTMDVRQLPGDRKAEGNRRVTRPSQKLGGRLEKHLIEKKNKGKIELGVTKKQRPFLSR